MLICLMAEGHQFFIEMETCLQFFKVVTCFQFFQDPKICETIRIIVKQLLHRPKYAKIRVRVWDGWNIGYSIRQTSIFDTIEFAEFDSIEYAVSLSSNLLSTFSRTQDLWDDAENLRQFDIQTWHLSKML